MAFVATTAQAAASWNALPQPGFQSVGKSLKHPSVVGTHARESGCQTRNRADAEEPCLLDPQRLAVAVLLIVPPCGIRELPSIAVLHGQIMEAAIVAERRQQLRLAPRPDPHHHMAAFAGCDCAFFHHFAKHVVRMIHDVLEAAFAITMNARRDHDQVTAGP
jgi:hypothetical protein